MGAGVCCRRRGEATRRSGLGEYDGCVHPKSRQSGILPPHPIPLPRNMHSLKATSLAGERGQNLADDYICDAHTHDG